MGNLFYLLLLLPILQELKFIATPIESFENSKRFAELTKLNKGKSYDDYDKEYKTECQNKLWYLLSLLFILIGIFSSQWILFIIFILSSLIFYAIKSLFNKFYYIKLIFSLFDSITSLSILILIILNKYHLKIDILSELTKLL